MTENEVALICQNYNIPKDYHTRLPCPEENCMGDIEERWMSVHEASFHLHSITSALDFFDIVG